MLPLTLANSRVIAGLTVMPTREHGEAWRLCEEQRKFIQDKLGDGAKLTKVRPLLRRNGNTVRYLRFGTSSRVMVRVCA
jgi:hypothetical protein